MNLDNERNGLARKAAPTGKTVTTYRLKLLLATLTFALLIVPTSYVLTFVFYAFGTKSTTLMDTASKVLYLT
ncbi:MAG: anti-sigma factor, partial [Bhargavaea sp.]